MPSALVFPTIFLLHETVALVIGVPSPAFRTVIFDCAAIFRKMIEQKSKESLFIETKVYIFFRHSATQIRLLLSKLIPGWFINNL